MRGHFDDAQMLRAREISHQAGPELGLETFPCQINPALAGPSIITPETFADFLPRKPRCSDYLDEGLLIRSRNTALKYRHLQLNPPDVYRWLHFDVDDAQAFFAAYDANLLPPTFVAQNPANGHAHLAYLLNAPVTNFAASRQSPMYFYAAVQRGMRRRLGADPCYTALIAKNPLHSDWRTEWRARRPYDLTELSDWLFAKDVRADPKQERSGVSRNCDVFDDTRRWAYANILRFKREVGSLDAWVARCQDVAAGHNLVFDTPLRLSETRSIGKSIAKWTWRKFSQEKFSLIQSRRIAKRWSGHTAAETTKPWLAEGIGRATWYRRRAMRAAMHPDDAVR